MHKMSVLAVLKNCVQYNYDSSYASVADVMLL